MDKVTKRFKEDRLGKLVTSFYADSTGTGPKETKVRIIEDMVIVRLKNQLTPVEKMLSTSKRLLDLVYKQRFEVNRMLCPRLTRILEKELGIKMISCYSDVHLLTGEQVLVFVTSADFNGVD